MEQSEEWLTCQCYLDMLVLEDEPECAATALTIFEVLTHDAALPEMNMKGSYPECEVANLHTIPDTTSIFKYYINSTFLLLGVTRHR
jgi:hypothetical protein